MPGQQLHKTTQQGSVHHGMSRNKLFQKFNLHDVIMEKCNASKAVRKESFIYLTLGHFNQLANLKKTSFLLPPLVAPIINIAIVSIH